MSGASTSGMKPAKAMSSRLLTMKFMQRAAASAVAKTPNTASQGAQSPSVEESDAPSPKRQRLSTKDSSLSPAAPPTSDLQAISAAIASEEQKRTEAISRQAAEAGETEWVLEFSGAGEKNTASTYGGRWGQFHIVPADSLDAEDEDYLYCGRRSYGNFKRKKNNQRVDDSSESDSEDDGSAEFSEIDMTDPVQIEAMIERAKARAEKKARQKKKAKHPDDVKLSRLTSISGSRGGITKPASSHHNHKLPDPRRGGPKRGRRG